MALNGRGNSKTLGLCDARLPISYFACLRRDKQDPRGRINATDQKAAPPMKTYLSLGRCLNSKHRSMEPPSKLKDLLRDLRDKPRPLSSSGDAEHLVMDMVPSKMIRKSPSAFLPPASGAG